MEEHVTGIHPPSPRLQEDEDYEDYCMFLQPAINAYNMSEKLLEANRNLANAENNQDQEKERARKVTFQDVLVTYEPDMFSSSTDDGGSSSDEDMIGHHQDQSPPQCLTPDDDHVVVCGEEEEEEEEEEVLVEPNFLSTQLLQSTGQESCRSSSSASGDAAQVPTPTAERTQQLDRAYPKALNSWQPFVESICEDSDSSSTENTLQLQQFSPGSRAVRPKSASRRPASGGGGAGAGGQRVDARLQSVDSLDQSDLECDLGSAGSVGEDEDVVEEVEEVLEANGLKVSCQERCTLEDAEPYTAVHNNGVKTATCKKTGMDEANVTTTRRLKSRKRNPRTSASKQAGQVASDHNGRDSSSENLKTGAASSLMTGSHESATAVRSDRACRACRRCSSADGPRLPDYRGLRSEYGLTAEQLQERRHQRAAAARRLAASRQQRRLEDDARRQENERRFRDWLAAKRAQSLTQGLPELQPKRFFPSCPRTGISARPRIVSRERDNRKDRDLGRDDPPGRDQSDSDSGPRTNAYCSAATCRARARSKSQGPRPAARSATQVYRHLDLLHGVSPHLQRTYRIYLGLAVK